MDRQIRYPRIDYIDRHKVDGQTDQIDQIDWIDQKYQIDIQAFSKCIDRLDRQRHTVVREINRQIARYPVDGQIDRLRVVFHKKTKKWSL